LDNLEFFFAATIEDDRPAVGEDNQSAVTER
jgi:hypothetical protein